ncbi:MAG: uridine kinase [Clostridia bacterium]|nr:uridine kinase [Clostridia bacterium]
MGKICVVGIAGGTASGKSTLVKNIGNHFGDRITVISHDSYYKAHDYMTYEERCKINYDHPDAFDTELMIEHVQKLKEGFDVEIPVYDFTVHNRAKGETEAKEPRDVIVVEGILVFADPRLRELMDVKIFVDTEADVRIMRRMKRDLTKRARTIESVIEQYETTVKPMHDQFVEPSKKYADIIIPHGGKNKVGVGIIVDHIESLLR